MFIYRVVCVYPGMLNVFKIVCSMCILPQYVVCINISIYLPYLIPKDLAAEIRLNSSVWGTLTSPLYIYWSNLSKSLLLTSWNQYIQSFLSLNKDLHD